jgi:hypothetical protein
MTTPWLRPLRPSKIDPPPMNEDMARLCEELRQISERLQQVIDQQPVAWPGVERRYHERRRRR